MRSFLRKNRLILSHIFTHVVLSVFLASTLFFLAPAKAEGQWFLFGRAQKQYEKCVQLYEEGQIEEAGQCIKEFLASYPNSRWVEHLQFIEAKMETSVSGAEDKLRHFTLEFPDGPYTAEANHRLGEILELKGDTEGAQKCYSRVYMYFWTSEFRDESGLRMAKCMLMRGDFESAIEHLDIYLGTHRIPPWQTRAQELQAEALYQTGEYVRAQNIYREIISEVLTPEEAPPRCYLRIAEIYEINRDHRAAFQAYRRFLNIFPNSIQKPAIEQKIAALASILKVDLSAAGRTYAIEAGVFKSTQKAMRLVARLKKLGYQAYLVSKNTTQEESLSVRLGPYQSRDSAALVADRLGKEAGIEATLLPHGGFSEKETPGWAKN